MFNEVIEKIEEAKTKDTEIAYLQGLDQVIKILEKEQIKCFDPLLLGFIKQYTNTYVIKANREGKYILSKQGSQCSIYFQNRNGKTEMIIKSIEINSNIFAMELFKSLTFI